MAASTGYLSPAVAKLLATACAELDRHVNQEGTCRGCGNSWPCEPACLAALMLEAV
jgi:hypothetical protein